MNLRDQLTRVSIHKPARNLKDIAGHVGVVPTREKTVPTRNQGIKTVQISKIIWAVATRTTYLPNNENQEIQE